MKKGLIINTVFENGGAAQVARDLFNIKNDSIEMYFAYGRGEKVNFPKTFKFGYGIESFLHVVFVRLFALDGLGSYFSTLKLIGYIKKNKFDFINFHNLHGYYLNYGLLFKFLKEINMPIVWTLHDEWILTWLPAHTMGCAHCVSGEGICTNKYNYPKTYNKFFVRRLLNRKRRLINSLRNVIFVSPAEWLSKKINLIFPNFSVKVIKNGISLPLKVGDKKYLREKYGLGENKKIILFSSNNLDDKNKGIRHILKAADDLVKDNNIVFLLAGKGKISSANVLSLGYLDKKQMSEIYALSDVYCFLSEAETMPLSLLEAKAAGLFIFASDIPANKEALAGYDRFEILTAESVNNLENKILSLKIIDGIKNVKENRTAVEFCEEYLSLYKEVLN